MNKRYQVFVSSTYADLKEERSKVIQTIMESDCIPAGMEIFPAIDEEQFNFIKSVIDDCDYYILIIGGRYGSLSEDGFSYTEKEYNYALVKEIKVIAFIHNKPDTIPFGKSEKDAALREKLEQFKSKVATGRLVKFWNNAEDLPGLVALSLTKTIKTYPAVGWVRANQASSVEMLQELNEQRKQNQELKARLQRFEKQIEDANKFDNLADLDDYFEIKGTRWVRNGGYKSNSIDGHSSTWNYETTWEEIFSLIAPYLMECPTDSKVKSLIEEALFKKSNASGTSGRIEPEIFQSIKIQLKILGLVSINYLATTQGGRALFWKLTELGEGLMNQLLTVKKTS